MKGKAEDRDKGRMLVRDGRKGPLQLFVAGAGQSLNVGAEDPDPGRLDVREADGGLDEPGEGCRSGLRALILQRIHSRLEFMERLCHRGKWLPLGLQTELLLQLEIYPKALQMSWVTSATSIHVP